MHISAKALKPLSGVQLSSDDSKIIAWIRRAVWEVQAEEREPKKMAKVPEFFNGVRLYHVQGGGSSQGPLELFIKKLEYHGVLGKQDMHPLRMLGNTRFLVLTPAELDNLGVGQEDDEE